MGLLHQEPLDVSNWHSLVRGSVLNYIVLALSLPWDFIKQAFHLADSLGFTELLLGHYQMLLLVLNCSRSWLHLPEFLLWKPAGQIIYMKTCQDYNWDIQYGIITWCCSIASSVIAIQAGWPPLVLQDCTPVSLLSQFIRCLHTCLVLQSILSWPFVCVFLFFFFVLLWLWVCLFPAVHRGSLSTEFWCHLRCHRWNLIACIQIQVLLYMHI